MPTRPPQAKAQTIFTVKAMNALMIHLPALPAEQNIKAEIAVPHPGPREIADAHNQRRLIGFDRVIAHRRPIKAQGGANAPLADALGRLHVPHDLAPPSRPQTFFDSTS